MEEEVLFKVELNQGSAFTNLERFKKGIIETKQEQTQLNQAFKAGNVTLDEYVAESVRLEQVLKKETQAYNQLTKQVQGHKSQTDKLIESNNKLSKSMDEGLNNASIFGTNLGGVKSSLLALTNPITLAAAGVTALTGLYAKSTIGAKDMEFASNQLSAAINLLGNEFASLFSSGKDGEGFFSGITNSIISSIDAGIGARSKLVTLNNEQLEDLNRDAKKALTEQQDLLADNADLLQQVADSQTSYNDKIYLANEAIDNIREGSDKVLAIRQKELLILQQQLGLDGENEALQDAVLDKELQISQEKKKTERLINNIIKLQSNINDTEQKRLETVSKTEEKERKILEHKNAQIDTEDTGVVEQGAIQEIVRAGNEEITSSLLNMTLQTNDLSKAIQDKVKANEKDIKASNAALKADKDRTTGLMILSSALGGVASLFKESTIANKVFSAAQAGINSFLAGTQVLRDEKLPTFAKIPAMIAIIGAGLAQQAKILGAFAEGGLVPGFASGGALSGTRINSSHGRPIRRSNGDNLLATVKTGEVILNERQQAALGGSRTFRAIGVPGFADGGGTSLTASTIARSSESRSASREIFDAIARIRPVVTVEDINLGQNRVDVIDSMAQVIA